MITILDESYDNVIDSRYIMAKINYDYAINELYPLINMMDQQRYTLKHNLYERLKADILKGCIMPPITIAIKSNDFRESYDIKEFINNNIKNALILDGIQRINTLKRLENELLDRGKPIYANILICNSMNKLIYRMITLNNGQKPMSVRHQIEVISNSIYNFEELPLNLVSEKESKQYNIKGEFKKVDIVKAYLAFISSSTNIDNQKIIEAKMDELITDKIIDSNITNIDVDFEDIIILIKKLSLSEYMCRWFRVTNNLIGFCAGISNSFNEIKNDINIEENLQRFEKAFESIDISKVKLGTARRKAVSMFISKYRKIKEYSEMDLLDIISEEI